jgi:thiol-disulfide isomerase/thioredoxin
MMKRLLPFLLLSTLLVGCGAGTSSPGNGSSYVAGNGAVTFIAPKDRVTAPSISGTALDGAAISPVKGVSVLNVWASWCGPCRAEAPTLQAISMQYPKVFFLGLLTRDDDDAARAFLRRFKITYPSLHDDNLILKFGKTLPPNAIPSTVIIDSRGRIAARISCEVTVAGLRGLLDKVLAE